ncbi:MAG TPA: DUF378 domain-containing protein [Candidatus Peribacteraceae bacterium]|nr:DUF378 domain-containing protein [Candidatus Peribacteraceae bacterium]
MEKSMIRNVAKLLVLIGSINWGLVGISFFSGGDLNIVKMIVGQWPAVEAIVYILVGLSALYLLIPGKRN